MSIPKDWNIKTLEEISHKVMVGIASAATHAYRDSGVIMLRNLNIKENRIDESDLLFIDPEYELQHKNKRIKAGDVITVRTGYPGVSAVVTDKFQSAQCFTSLITRPKPELINSHFLSAYINSEYGRKFIVEAEAGGAQKNVNAGSLSKMPIPLPSMKEQCKIIKVLGVWDESIDLLEKLIAAKRKLKRGLTQRLLTGEHRFKEFEDNEWESTSIVKIAKLTAGGTPNTNIVEYWNGGIPWMKSGDISLKRIHNVEGRITQSGFDNSSTKKIPPHSVLIALAGQGKTRGLVAINEVEICTNQSIAAIMPNSSKVYFEYLYYNLESRYQELRGLSSGDGGRGGLNLKILGQIEIELPTLAEQEKIAAVLSAADAEISTLEKQLAAYKEQKRGLMQQLLTGRTRILGLEDEEDKEQK